MSIEEGRSLLSKTANFVLSCLPGGQYLAARNAGRSQEDMKWFKRLEIFRAGFLALAAAGALTGDPLSIAINSAAYLFATIPANVDPPEDRKGNSDRLSPGNGLVSVFSSPRLATYFAAGFLANNIAAFGGPNMMYAESSPFTNVDTITHFMGGMSFGQAVDTFLEKSGVAGKAGKAFNGIASRIEGSSWVGGKVKGMFEYLGAHAGTALTVGSFALIGPMWEATEYAGAQIFRSSSTAIAALRESSFNWLKDLVMNTLGGAVGCHIQDKEKKSA